METGGNHDESSRRDHETSDPLADWPDPLPPQRLGPVPAEERTPEVAALLDSMKFGDRPVGNIFATLAHHPELLKRWTAFGGALLFQGVVGHRDRELLILRTAWNCRAHYEWGHHVPMARRFGVTDEEIERITGSDGDGWSDEDALLIRAADELHESNRISDATWAGLEQRYDPAQLVEICMVVGQYHLVAFTLNSLGVQYEGTPMT